MQTITWTLMRVTGDTRALINTFDTKRKLVNAMNNMRKPGTAILKDRNGRVYTITVKE